MKKLLKRILEYLILDDIYKIIFELGGADAQNNWARGWDCAIDSVEYEIQRLVKRKFG